MKKQWILVGMLASVMLGSPALIAQHKAPNTQPTTAQPPSAPTGEVPLGTVRIPRSVTADGKPLPAGTYTVKVTAQEAKPEAVGTTEPLERWAEFSQGGAVKGREVVTIVPQAEIKMVVKDAPPRHRHLKGADAQGQRLSARLGQQRRESLPDSPADRRHGDTVKKERIKKDEGRRLRKGFSSSFFLPPSSFLHTAITSNCSWWRCVSGLMVIGLPNVR